jgi:hypothetical protein
MISEQLRADRHRRYAQGVMTEALRAHRSTLQSGRSVMIANVSLVETIRERSRVGQHATLNEVEEKGALRRGFDAVLQTALEGLAGPLVDGLLGMIGLDAYPRIRGAIKRVLVNAFVNILTDEKYKLLSLTCEDIGKALAESVAETLPEKIFDELVGAADIPFVPGAVEGGLMLSVREAISNFFKDQRVVQAVSDQFGKIICDIDLTRLISSGGRQIASSWSGSKGAVGRIA